MWTQLNIGTINNRTHPLERAQGVSSEYDYSSYVVLGTMINRSDSQLIGKSAKFKYDY